MIEEVPHPKEAEEFARSLITALGALSMSFVVRVPHGSEQVLHVGVIGDTEPTKNSVIASEHLVYLVLQGPGNECGGAIAFPKEAAFRIGRSMMEAAAIRPDKAN